MSFYGLDFIFDGQYSENFGLKIMSINGNLTTNASAGCGIEIFADHTARNATAYHQGVAQNEVLSFDMELVSEEEIDGLMRGKINRWLFGRLTYKKLYIVQPDLSNIYFNCHLINPELTYIGNVCHGLTCRVECDAPWAWENERKYSITKSTSVQSWKLFNDSDDCDYLYPTVTITMASDMGSKTVGNVSIKNVTDNNREMVFEDIPEGRQIEINCKSQAIRYLNGTELLIGDNFNKKFFRLLPGSNNIQISGDWDTVEIRYRKARKVGG